MKTPFLLSLATAFLLAGCGRSSPEKNDMTADPQPAQNEWPSPPAPKCAQTKCDGATMPAKPRLADQNGVLLTSQDITKTQQITIATDDLSHIFNAGNTVKDGILFPLTPPSGQGLQSAEKTFADQTKLLYHSQRLSYSRFGTITPTAPAQEPLAYSAGIPTPNFEEMRDKTAVYSGNAILTAQQNNAAPQHFGADFSATVQFVSNAQNPLVTGDFSAKIHHFSRLNNDNSRELVTDFAPIRLEGKTLFSADHVRVHPQNDDLQFKVAFYGRNAEEIGGIVVGEDDKYGHYHGAFGGEKRGVAVDENK